MKAGNVEITEDLDILFELYGNRSRGKNTLLLNIQDGGQSPRNNRQKIFQLIMARKKQKISGGHKKDEFSDISAVLERKFGQLSKLNEIWAPQKSTRIGGLEGEDGNENTEELIKSGEIPPSLKAHIERNRQKALLLKQARLIPHPYAKINTSESVEKSIIRVQGSKFIDTGGGFLLEEGQVEAVTNPNELVVIPPPIIEPERPSCLECNEKFPDSFLLQHFDYPVCDKCRDNEDKHALITRTEAKSEYLLKDCDFDKREPPLKYISRKNPHNSNWGEMKLYLQLQIEKRALEVWGSELALEEERDRRNEKKEVAKFRKYQKEMKSLRMNVRSALFDRTTASYHVHDFGPETCVEEDIYMHSCKTCGLEERYEKM